MPRSRPCAGRFRATLFYFSPVGRHFPELLESEAIKSYGGLRTFASLGPNLAGLRVFLVAMAGDQGFARAFEQGPTRFEPLPRLSELIDRFCWQCGGLGPHEYT